MLASHHFRQQCLPRIYLDTLISCSPLHFFLFFLPLSKDHLIINQLGIMPAFESFPRPDCQLVEQWDPFLFIPSLNLSQSCLDKHGWRQMNSQSLCSAPLASSAILWSSYWDHSSAPSHPLSALGDWQSVTDPLPPLLLPPPADPNSHSACWENAFSLFICLRKKWSSIIKSHLLEFVSVLHTLAPAKCNQSTANNLCIICTFF